MNILLLHLLFGLCLAISNNGSANKGANLEHQPKNLQTVKEKNLVKQSDHLEKRHFRRRRARVFGGFRRRIVRRPFFRRRARVFGGVRRVVRRVRRMRRW